MDYGLFDNPPTHQVMACRAFPSSSHCEKNNVIVVTVIIVVVVATVVVGVAATIINIVTNVTHGTEL